MDHFNYGNKDQFQQRYIISDEHWKPNGPIFFYCGNEGDVFAFVNNTGFMWDNAKDFHAMVIFMEHRYYGESMPYGKKSLTDPNAIAYLTVEQALADFAEFLTELKLSTPEAKFSPIIAFGGSYGGMLATWFRMKYPHIVAGALAASAPILQFPGLYDCLKYNEIATKDFQNYSPKCSQSIRNSWEAIRAVSKQSDGLKLLTEQFQLCSPLTSETVQILLDWISEIWSLLPMIDYPNEANFLSPLPAYPIKVICQYLTEPEADNETLMKAIAKAVSVYTNYTGTASCNDIAGSTDNDRLGTGAWEFQSCTEMVLPICSNGVDDMFEKSPWNFTQFSKGCQKQFNVNPEKNKAFVLFGGKNINDVTNIIFSNGDRDPWSAGGVLESISDTLIAIKIPGACHHEDLRSRGPNDPQPLLDARRKELSIIKEWLQKNYQQNNVQFVW